MNIKKKKTFADILNQSRQNPYQLTRSEQAIIRNYYAANRRKISKYKKVI